MKTKKLKRLCSFLLAAVLVGSCFQLNTGEAKAAEVEPSFDADTCRLLYNGSFTMEQGDKSLGVTVAENATYYVSFTVQTSGEVYFDYRGTAARIYLGQTQYALLGVSPANIWPQGDIGLSKGAKITLKSTPTTTTIWVNGAVGKNGAVTLEDIPITSAAQGIPKISWAQTTTSFTDLKVWTISDAPKYNPETDVIRYEDSEVTMAAETNKNFGVTIPADETYYGSFTVKSTNYVYFDYRGSGKARIMFGTGQCGFIGLTSDQYPQGDKGLSGDGIRVTFRSEPTKTTIWINGEKTDNLELADTSRNLVGTPCISWVDSETTITNIAFWQKRTDVLQEPVYNKAEHTLFEIDSWADGCTYENGILTVPPVANADGRKAGIGTKLPENSPYYMTMRIKTGGSVNIQMREGTYVHIETAGYQFMGTDIDNGWVSEPSLFKNLSSGLRITIYSDSDNFTVWVDGVRQFDGTYTVRDKKVKPDISWNFNNEVTADYIQIWSTMEKCQGNSITLNGKIGVNWYMSLDASIAETAKMQFTLPNGEVQSVSGNWDSAKGSYKFTCEVAAKEMTQNIKAQLVTDTYTGIEYTYCVKDYADYILNPNNQSNYQKEIPLVKAMLNYGAYAQTRFNYHPDKLANADLDPQDKDVTGVTTENLETYAKTLQTKEGIATLYGASLILESETSLKLFFTLPSGANVNEYTFELKEKKLDATPYEDYYYVKVEDINARSLGEDCEVKVTRGEQSFTVSYCPMTYCYNALNSEQPENLQNVVKALYLYNQKAVEYFNSQQ